MTPVAIPVLRGGRVFDHAWIDAVDAERVRAYTWVWAGGYAVASGAGPMHRHILSLEPFDRVVHHVNEDTLDNRRSNLKVLASKIAHAGEPHPRRDRRCGGLQNPPHERVLALRDEAA